MENQSPRDGMDDWWTGIDKEVLACLNGNRETSPAAVGRRLAVSEAAAASLLSMLAAEGRVRICLVGLPGDPPELRGMIRASKEP